MSSYALYPRQVADLAQSIRDRADYIAELIAKGVAANAQHNRAATVTLALKISRNQDDPRIIEVEAQEKIKQPKSRYSDLTSWDESSTIVCYRTDVDPGQALLDGAENALGLLKKMAEDGDMQIELISGGKSATIGKKTIGKKTDAKK